MANESKEAKAKPRRPQAQKRVLQSEKRRLRNNAFKSSVRTTIRKFEEALSSGDANNIQESLNQVYSAMDKGVKRGNFKINKASRIKARLTARVAKAA